MNYVLHDQLWFTDLSCLIIQHSFTDFILHARRLPLDLPRLRPVQCVLHTFTDPDPAHLHACNLHVHLTHAAAARAPQSQCASAVRRHRC